MSIDFGKKANDLLGDHIKPMEPYDGKTLSDIPDEAIKSAKEAERYIPEKRTLERGRIQENAEQNG